jgi:hypothetical protein
MFKLKEKRKSIKKVCSNGKVLFYLTKENNIFQDGKLIFEGELNSDIRICKNHFYTFGNSDISYLGDFIDNSVTKIDFTFSSECIWREGAIINENYRYDTLDGKVKADYSILNFKTKEKRLLFKDLEGIITCIFNDNNKAIYRLKTTLRSLSLLTGEYDWEVDLELYLPNEDYIKTIYGVVGNGLWLTSYWGVLICIDILSGTIVHLLNYENVDYKTPNVGTMYAQSLFDEHNKKLIGVYKKQYWEIDLQNPPLAMQTYDLTEYNSDYFKDEWHNPEGMKFDEDYIYFRDVERSTIGILNRNTKIIDWHNKLRDVEPRPVDIINDIQITKNKIYTLLTDGTLFVFEKDEVVNV